MNNRNFINHFDLYCFTKNRNIPKKKYFDFVAKTSFKLSVKLSMFEYYELQKNQFIISLKSNYFHFIAHTQTTLKFEKFNSVEMKTQPKISQY